MCVMLQFFLYICGMKKHKIIFLDVDGVLNSARFAEEHYKQTGKPLFMYDFLDPDAVDKMTEYLKCHPNVRLVISSSWRSGDYKEDVEFFLSKGTAPLVPFIVGATGRSHDLHRGYEINHFLLHHNEEEFNWLQGEPFEISEYVVVDDDDFDISDNLKPNFVHVDANVGLTDEDYQMINEILKEEDVQKKLNTMEKLNKELPDINERSYYTADEAISILEKRIRAMFRNKKK